MEYNKKRNRVVGNIGGSGRNTTSSTGGGGSNRGVIVDDVGGGTHGGDREDVTRPIPSEEPIIINRSNNNTNIKEGKLLFNGKVKTSSEEVGRVNQLLKETKKFKKKN